MVCTASFALQGGACNETNDRNSVCAGNDGGRRLGADICSASARAAYAEVGRGENRGENKEASGLEKKAKAAAPAQELPAQTMPPVPATLMNSAPVKPNVTMERGLLTIDAPNSTLSDVLSGVQQGDRRGH